MLLSHTLLLSFSAFVAASDLFNKDNGQCKVITSVYTGQPVWYPTATYVSAKKPPKQQGTYTIVLGEPTGSNNPAPNWSSWGEVSHKGHSTRHPIVVDPSAAWNNWGSSSSKYAQSPGASGSQYTYSNPVTGTSQTAYPTIPTSGSPGFGHPSFGSPSGTPSSVTTSHSSYTTTIATTSISTTKSSSATHSVVAGDPFVASVQFSGKKARRDLAYLSFSKDDATLVHAEKDAVLLVLDLQGVLTTYVGHKYIGTTNSSGTNLLELFSQPSVTSQGWFIDGSTLQFPGISFCVDNSNSPNIRAVFGKTPANCVPVTLVPSANCAKCVVTTTTSSTTTTGASTSASASTTTVSTSLTTTTTASSSSVSTSITTTITGTSSTLSNTTTTVLLNTTTTGAPYGNGTASNDTISGYQPASNDTTSGYEPHDEFAGPISLGEAPPTILSAGFAPDLDMGSLDRFVPQPRTNLWFNGPGGGDDSTDSGDGSVSVRVAINYTYPSIILDQSVYITNLVCSASSITGSIDVSDAFKAAQKQWQPSPLIFITTTPACVPSGASAFWFVSSGVQFSTDGSMTFAISGSATNMSAIFTYMGVDFGKIQYDPLNVSNSTASNSTSVTDTCGSPNSTTLDGLPAVSCGSAFDQTLDDFLGYYSQSGDQDYVLNLAAPGANNATVTRRSSSYGVYPQHLNKRFSLCGSLCKKIEKKVVNTVVKIAAPIVKAVAPYVAPLIKPLVAPLTKVYNTVKKDLGKAIAKTVHILKVVDQKLKAVIPSVKYSKTLKLPLQIGPSKAMMLESPWGEALRFYKWTPDKKGEKWKASQTALEKIRGSLIGEPDPQPGVEFFCVDCGIKGTVAVTGSIAVKPVLGIQSASLSAKGNMHAGLFLGVNAFAEYNKKWIKPLLTQGLPGWSIPGIVALGPMLTLGIQAGLDLTAEGQLLTGASLDWPNFQATLNVLDNGRSTQSGFKPNVEHKFEVEGTLNASVSLGLPVALEFGINILDNTWGTAIALTDTPAVKATASLAASYNVDTGTTLGTEECPGIAWDIGLTNDIVLGGVEVKEEKGVKKLEDKGPQFTLSTWEGPKLASGCIPLGKNGGDENHCSAWTNKQWKDSRSNKWNIACNVTSNTLTNLVVVNSTKAAGMLECLETCSYDNGKCERAAWIVSSKTCVLMNTNTCNPALQQCNTQSLVLPCSDSACPSSQVSMFDAVSSPVSPFTIISVLYSNIDVTSFAIASAWNRGHYIQGSVNGYVNLFGNDGTDGSRAWIMYYKYNSEYRVLTSLESATYDIQAGPIAFPEAQRVSPDLQTFWSANLQLSSTSWIRIYDYAWGGAPIASSHSSKIMTWWYDSLSSSSVFTMGNVDFDGVDTRFGYQKVGAIFYENFVTNPGVIKSVHAWEYQNLSASQFDAPAAVAVKRGIEARAPQLSTTPGPVPSSTTSASVSTTSSTSTDSTSTTPTTTTTTTSIGTSTISTTTTSAIVSPTGLSNSTASNYTIYYAGISDSDNYGSLQIGVDGNLWMATTDLNQSDINTYSSNNTFIGVQSSSSFISGDDNGSYLHYFPAEMTATGVSRLRLATWDKLPVGSALVTLLQIDDGSGNQIVAAADTQGNYGWLWVCTFDNYLNKVFITKDSQASAATLMDASMKFIVTGAQATNCVALAMSVTWGDPVALDSN